MAVSQEGIIMEQAIVTCLYGTLDSDLTVRQQAEAQLAAAAAQVWRPSTLPFILCSQRVMLVIPARPFFPFPLPFPFLLLSL